MRLVLDEMWSPAIAVQLRRRAHDVISAQEPDHAARYRSISDALFLQRAEADRRAIVTDNIEDFEALIVEIERAGAAHHGVVYCTYSAFDRSDPRIVGRMVGALDALLRSRPAEIDPFNRRHWLRPV